MDNPQQQNQLIVTGKRATYPCIVINKAIVFPGEQISLVIEGDIANTTVRSTLSDNHLIVLLFQYKNEPRNTGIVAKILQSWQLTPQITGMTVGGLERVYITRTFMENNVQKVEIAEIARENKSEEEKTQLEAISRSVYNRFKQLLQLRGTLPAMVLSELQKTHLSPGRISDVVAAALPLGFQEKLVLLETLDVYKRLEMLNNKLAKELEVVETEKKIDEKVAKEMGKTQREYILRERLKAIENELGIQEEKKEYEELEEKIKAALMPEDVQKKAIKELNRLRKMPPMSAEVPYIRTYLEWLVDVPWSKRSKQTFNLKEAEKILHKDHYGLKKAKERIIEYLAVQKLTKGKGRGSILCFVGPPGTGKTSVGRSIAESLGRKFVRVSLGGIRDEAEIRGHRRTYVGALPGRIIQGMKTAGVKNPVFMLDEVDKLIMDFHGDPSAALLEVLDPEQNNTFADHYLEVPYDLSEVLFIATANVLDPIPTPLKDRMEVIEFHGYTDEEKFHIAKEFLLSRVIKRSGLRKKQLSITDGTIKKIIQKYTREAGVRNLERKLADVARKVAKRVAEEGKSTKVTVIEEDITNYLGPEEYTITMREEKDEVGVSTGLAWTPVGGDILFIEVSLVPGKGNVTLTGQLGDVMQESAKAALSYIRSRSKELNIDQDLFQKTDIHIHVPTGAIPKDGPSAGIALATAFASAVTGRKVRKEIGMTGEITLRGKVLKIGGIKEKVLAAHRGGVEKVLLPEENEKDLIDLPEIVKKELAFQSVKHMDEVLSAALI